jgi:CMP-N,N'-diacetyllegionaminic acid synthase
MKTLFIITARGGSKGLPGKNIKPLNGKPLIIHSLAYARLFAADADICISTDSDDIAAVAVDYDYQMPFMRPAHLATDTAGSYEVLLHALQHYEALNGTYERVVLLQPTSPFRKQIFFEEAVALFHARLDMVVSVKESKANPYFNLFEQDGGSGYLQASKKAAGITRRQDAPPVYEYNGSLYIINRQCFNRYTSFAQFEKVIKYVMPAEYSCDIDTGADWMMAEYLLNQNLTTIDGKYKGYSEA